MLPFRDLEYSVPPWKQWFIFWTLSLLTFPAGQSDNSFPRPRMHLPIVPRIVSYFHLAHSSSFLPISLWLFPTQRATLHRGFSDSLPKFWAVQHAQFAVTRPMGWVSSLCSLWRTGLCAAVRPCASAQWRVVRLLSSTPVRSTPAPVCRGTDALLKGPGRLSLPRQRIGAKGLRRKATRLWRRGGRDR